MKRTSKQDQPSKRLQKEGSAVALQAILILMEFCPSQFGPLVPNSLMDLRLLCRELWKAWHTTWQLKYREFESLFQSDTDPRCLTGSYLFGPSYYEIPLVFDAASLSTFIRKLSQGIEKQGLVSVICYSMIFGKAAQSQSALLFHLSYEDEFLPLLNTTFEQDDLFLFDFLFQTFRQIIFGSLTDYYWSLSRISTFPKKCLIYLSKFGTPELFPLRFSVDCLLLNIPTDNLDDIFVFTLFHHQCGLVTYREFYFDQLAKAMIHVGRSCFDHIVFKYWLGQPFSSRAKLGNALDRQFDHTNEFLDECMIRLGQ